MSEVVFRRIRGRIVPIRKKKKDSIKEAAAFTAAGVSASIVSGRNIGKAVSKMTDRKIFRFTADEIKRRVKRQKRISRNFRISGQITGGVLLSQGIQKFLKSQGVNESASLDVGAEVGSQAAAAIISNSARKQFAIKGFKVPTSLKRSSKKLLQALVKKKLKI